VWCGRVDSPDSEGRRSARDADCSALLAKLSTVPAGCCTSVVLFSIFVVVCFLQRPLVSISFVVAGTVDVYH
jgi:hypothetical protein